MNCSGQIKTPWRRIGSWYLAFFLLYLPRFLPLEIWRASKTVEVDFSEMKFGETPLRTVNKILSFLPEIGPDSLVYDLGCGRGCAAFFFHFLSLARVKAFDLVPGYIETGRRLASWSGCAEEVRFFCQDFRGHSLEDADLVYACALCFQSETRRALLESILQTKPGCYLVSVGWRPVSKGLVETAHFKSAFSWGSSWVTICRRADDSSAAINS